MSQSNLVAVIGAGPAGLYASKQLASNGAKVVLFNRDVKPGGLAEYGIFHNKYRMKTGLRKQFHKIMQDDNITYYGNVTIGQDGDFTLTDLKEMGFQAIMVAVGAQGTKWLGLPGEELEGVYHAKDLVYHYNNLPPYSEQNFVIGKRVALIGVGNVMIDIAHWCIRDLKVDKVTAVARRGPAEVKFTRKEMEHVAANLDVEALDAEIERVAENMRSVNQNPEEAKEFILSALPKADEKISDTRFAFWFLSSPSEILGEDGKVTGLKVNDTELILRDGRTKPVPTGTTRVLDVDTVIFCIGDKVDESFGLPVEWNEFVKNPNPLYPVNDVSFEAYDPQTKQPLEGIFVSGWSREASSGLVGIARKDGEAGADAMLEYLASKPKPEDIEARLEEIQGEVHNLSHPVVQKEGIWKLIEIENKIRDERGLADFKFGSNQKMLEAIGMMAAG